MESHPATLAIPAGVRGKNPCPTDDDILAFLPGELSGPQAESIAAHLATCALCQSRVSTLRQRLTDQERGRQAAALVPQHAAALQNLSDSPPTVSNELRPHAGWRLNEYELLEPIGRGGMGVVYRARHARLQRTVAVKVLPRMSLPDESAVVRMQRESAAAGRVQHPNIVYATDAGECDGAHYLVMEYVQGFDLSKLVAAVGQLPIADACEIIRQAALGLGHIAECGLVHRDLKPSNVMLADDGSVKVLDLGLALLHHNPLDNYEATQPGYLLGTADYIAPEQIDAPHEVDVRSDLYSLGCTLFKLLTGVAPFSGPEQNSVSRKVEAHRHKPAPPVRSQRPDVPAEVEQIMARLLAKRPKDRFQRPGELATALAPLAKGADLAGLARRMRESGQQNAPLGGPVDSRATTQSLAASATPRHLSARIRELPAWGKMVAGVVLTGVIALGLLGVSAFVGRDRAIAYDLTRPLKEYQYNGWVSSPAPTFDRQVKLLEVNPGAHQLLEIGEYRGRPGTFSFTLNQAPWHGCAGMYFGLREEPRPGQPAIQTTMQVFLFEYHPAWGTGDGALPERFSFTRRRAFLPVLAPPQLNHDLGTEKAQHFNASPPQIRFDIKFGPAGCERVVANGQALDELTAPGLNAKYRPADYLGPFGLYCLPSPRPGKSWFGNLVFTPAE